jgi:hypothetical protein
MTLPAQKPGPKELCLAHGGQHLPGPHLAVTRFVTAGTGKFPLVRGGRFAAQQMAECGGAGLMHGGSYRHLDRFQIYAASFALLLKDESEQGRYFPFDFPMDDFRRFFSCGVRLSSTGRERQIFSLTSSSSWLSSRKR